MIDNVLELIGKIEFGVVGGIDGEVVNHYLEDTVLYIQLSNGKTLIIDIKDYIGELTKLKLDAIEGITISIVDDVLVISYDDNLLEIEFSVVDGNLIIEDNDINVDFKINDNKEMEVVY